MKTRFEIRKEEKSSTEKELPVRCFPEKKVPGPNGKTGSVKHFV